MHRAALLALGTTAILLKGAFAFPQTRRPSATTTAGLTNPTPLSGPNGSPPTQEVIRDIIDNVVCTDPVSGTTTTYKSHDIDIEATDSPPKHKLSKRGNCLPRMQEDNPGPNQILRPAAPMGIHYSQYRPPDDPGLVESVSVENLVAEPSVERSVVEVVRAGPGGGRDEVQDDQDGFDVRMDEYDGDGLEPGALGFERGIVDVPGGVSGGINGGYGPRANRRRLETGFDDIIQEALQEYAAVAENANDDESPDFQGAHSRPQEPNPINLDDSEYSIINEGTLDEMRRAVMHELASGYGSIGVNGVGEADGPGGDLGESPDTTDIPLQSVPTGQESQFQSAGDETIRLLWGDNRVDFGWPIPRGG
ncbi:hypothetical protein TWF718_009085 [Orbilia javanica]|uniref:Uncharacterized protein n=1 Tax=Orbilia javanica TaxID=47235 RepID=A0AAN8MLP7_9PEZI